MFGSHRAHVDVVNSSMTRGLEASMPSFTTRAVLQSVDFRINFRSSFLLVS